MGQRQAQAAVQDDAHGGAAFQSGQTDVEARVVDHRGAAADDHGIVGGPQQMPPRPRRGAGDPSTLAAMGGDPAVEAAADLEGHQGPAL